MENDVVNYIEKKKYSISFCADWHVRKGLLNKSKGVKFEEYKKKKGDER